MTASIWTRHQCGAVGFKRVLMQICMGRERCMGWEVWESQLCTPSRERTSSRTDSIQLLPKASSSLSHTWLETVVSALQPPARSVVMAADKWIFPLNPNRTFFFWKKGAPREWNCVELHQQFWMKRSWRECLYNAKFCVFQIKYWLAYSFFFFLNFIFYFLEAPPARHFQLRKKKNTQLCFWTTTQFRKFWFGFCVAQFPALFLIAYCHQWIRTVLCLLLQCWWFSQAPPDESAHSNSFLLPS